MRRDVEITAEGVVLRGWFYLPERAAGPAPCIVMAHGFSAVKEMYLDHFAEVFAAAGLAALVYDNRSFGASGGEPRQEIDPVQQVRVKCVVSQVPLVSGYRNVQRLIRADMFAPLRQQLDADREARFRGEAPMMIPVVTQDPNAPAALPTADSWQWFVETGKTRAPAWRNEVTLRTVEMLTEYEPGDYV